MPWARPLLDQAMALSLLSWRVHVFEPARALKRLGLYRAPTLGAALVPGVPGGGGPELSRRHREPVLLPGEPAGYHEVREFDRMAGVYEAVVRPFSEPIIDEVVALMQPLSPRARVLDPSAGPGEAALRLARLVPEGEVVAADLSRGMVETAWKVARQAGCHPNMAFFQADVGKPPEAFEGYFDAIVCCLSFHHYPDGEAAVRAFRRVLAPGGRVFVADGGPRWFVELARPISVLADPGFVRHRTGEEFLQLFTEAGFSTVSWTEVLPGMGVTIASV
ncbi:SAM-dependent methyltransferase [Vitiosangium sp. GDMCC 1.1324]|nr:SAM-dependent methyltransferase [Vitiosangium sp. GDMCC 1.1324]